MAVRRKPTKKSATRSLRRQRDDEDVRRLTIWLPAELARQFKIYCAANETTMSAVVEELVRAQVGMPMK